MTKTRHGYLRGTRATTSVLYSCPCRVDGRPAAGGPHTPFRSVPPPSPHSPVATSARHSTSSTPLHCTYSADERTSRVPVQRLVFACHLPSSSHPMASAPHALAVKAVLPNPRPPSSTVLARRAAPGVVSLRAASSKAWRGATLVAAAAEDQRPAIDEYPEGILSGEWPENFSLLSYADLRAYLESQIVTSDKMSPTAKLGDVMSRPVQVATPGQRLADIDAFFAAQSGLPVVDDEGRCIGVVSKKDKDKATKGMESTVGVVMSSPAITLTPEKTVLEAAALMLKAKVHRIPVVNEQQQVIGIVTRTDVFQALEASKA
ncbi:hypothetical protein EJB05_47083, partial [Eragrostis curvula]